MPLRRLLPTAVGALLPLAACDLNENLPTQLAGGGSGTAGASFSFSDPADDVAEDADPLTAPDVTRLSGTVSGDSLTLQLTFRRPVARFSAGGDNALDGVIELDMDETENTGAVSIITTAGGSSRMGVEYYVLLRDVASDSVELVNAVTNERTRVGATFAATTVILRLLREDVEDTDGRFRLGAVVGTREAPTDFAPDAGAYTVAR